MASLNCVSRRSHRQNTTASACSASLLTLLGDLKLLALPARPATARITVPGIGGALLWCRCLSGQSRETCVPPRRGRGGEEEGRLHLAVGGEGALAPIYSVFATVGAELPRASLRGGESLSCRRHTGGCSATGVCCVRRKVVEWEAQVPLQQWCRGTVHPLRDGQRWALRWRAEWGT